MSQPNKISEYIKTVCEQIRWKKAHPYVSKELTDHITDQKDAFLKQGMSENEAEIAAIKQMGDPVVVGTQLDGTYRPKPNWSIIIFTIALLLLGVAIKIILNISDLVFYSPRYLNTTIITTIIGIAVFTAGYLIDFTLVGRYAKSIYFGYIIVLLVLSRSYFLFDQTTINILTLLFPVIYAGIIYQHRGKGYLGLLACGVYFFIPAYFIFSGISTLIMLSIICFVLLTFAILKGWFNIKKSLGLIMIILIPLPIIGLIIYQNINYGIETSNYYLHIAKDAVYNAKLIGKSTHFLFVPNTYTLKSDYTLAYLIFEYGWISFAVIAAIFAAFLIKAFSQIKKLKNLLGKLTSQAVLLTLTVQILFYILRNLGLLPVYAATLPFFSFNSLSIIINMLLVGIMLSVYKTGNLISDEALPKPITEKRKTLELINGKVTINIYRK